jgi:hypothetical protein
MSIDELVDQFFLKANTEVFSLRENYNELFQQVSVLTDEVQSAIMEEMSSRLNKASSTWRVTPVIRVALLSLVFRKPSTFFYRLDTTAMEYWLPELSSCRGCTQNSFHSDDVFVHTMKSVDACSEIEGAETLDVKLVTLFHDIGKPYVRSVEPVNCEIDNLHSPRPISPY